MKRPSLAILAFLILLLNSAYLYAFATPSLFYFTNVGLHVVLGIVVAVAFVRWLRPGLPPSPLVLLATPLLVAGGGLGLYLTYHGATRDFRWALLPHIVATAAGSLLLLVYLYRRSQERGSPWGRGWPSLGMAVVVVVVGLPLAVRLSSPRVPRDEQILNPTLVATSMDGEGAGPQSPFFPSSANTNVNGIIPSNFFMHSEACGRCHTEIFKQWKSSAHHFSSFNNQWYRKSIEYMQEVQGSTRGSKWCAGCHDHAVFFNGRFDKPIKEQIHTPEAQAGLACTSCHAIVHVKSTMGQGDFDIEYPPLHDLAVSENKTLAWAHDKLLELDPEPHKKTFLKAFHRQQSPEFCSSCHKVHLDVPVNNYRWFRGFNEYDAWQASGVSGEGARSFYYPAKPMKCVSCHMPLVAGKDPAAVDGKVHSHRFPAANTALPFVNKDPEQLKVVQDFLRDGQISVDVFGIVRAAAPVESGHEKRGGNEPELATSFAQGEESSSMGASSAVMLPAPDVLAPIDKVQPTVRRGDSVRVEVVVRTRKVGHFFPGGTVDAFDVWVELEAVDDKGRTIFHSGEAADAGNGPVDPGAHKYRSLLLDEHGNWINKRNAFMARSVAYVRLIPPGAADTIHYRLDIPADCGDKITLRAKVNYRKFTWWNTQFAFAGRRDPADPRPDVTKNYDDGKWIFTGDTSDVSGEVKAIPSIPTTVMAETAAVLKVAAKGAPLPADKPFLDKSVRERWNDYGIGLLLQGDIKGAEAAFLNVTTMEPGYADGWVNVARARVQEGQMAAAEPVLRKALEIDPKLAKTHFFLAMALKPQGQYDEAIGHLRTALEQYPRDRVVRNQLGRVLFLKREFKEAIAEFQKVLAIDPEDLQAHYNLMLCYQGTGDTAATEQERTLYQRFKADESAQSITGPYRQLHPEDNNERQSIHEHRSGPLAPTAPPPSKPKYDEAKRVAEGR